MRKRSTLDIVFEILELLYERECCKKTEIVYKVNLNFKSADKYLETLVRSGLIKCNILNNCKMYHITNKGRDFYEKVKYFKNLLKEIMDNF